MDHYKFIDYGTDNVEYLYIYKTRLNGSVSNMSFVTSEGNFGFFPEDSSCNSYYICRVSSYTYTPQEDMNIDGKIICSDVILWVGTYFGPVKF